jgi:DNA-binding FadR family transcriptional regulator
MGHLARLAEILVRISGSGDVPPRSKPLETAIAQGNLPEALQHLEALLGPVSEDAPVVALEVPERGFSLSGRKSAMALAARLARELGAHTGTQEAEWETADRLGYTDAAVRQARRILQDFGIVRCRRGRKGTELAPTSPPTGVIRLLAACLVASAGSPMDLSEAIHALISCAPALAAKRVKAAGSGAAASANAASVPDAFELLTLEHRLLDLSGNPLLAIIVRSLGLANIFIARGTPTPLHLRDVMALNRRILRAIEAGDVATAGVLAKLKLQRMQQSDEEFQGAA